MTTILAKLILPLTAATLFFTACKPEDTTPTVVKETGKIQVFHAAVDAPAIDFQVDSKKVNTDSLVYSKGTAYFSAEFTAGNKTGYKIISSKTGQAISADSLQLESKDKGYSVFLYQDKDAAKTIRAFSVPDILLLPAAGKAKIRLVNLMPDVNNNIDVEAVTPGSDVTTSSQFSNVSFPKLTDYVEIPKGSYDFKVKLSGTKTTLPSFPNVTFTFEEGKIYTVVARGYANKTGVSGGTLTIITNK